MKRLLIRLVRGSPSRSFTQGQGLVEYALILMFVAIVAIAVLVVLGPTLGKSFGDISCFTKYGTAAIYANEAEAKKKGTYKDVYFDPQSTKPAACYALTDPQNKGKGDEVYIKLGDA